MMETVESLHRVRKRCRLSDKFNASPVKRTKIMRFTANINTDNHCCFFYLLNLPVLCRIAELMQKNNLEEAMVGIEPTGHYWFDLGQFIGEKNIKFVIVNLHHVHKTKELDDNSPQIMIEKIRVL